MTTLLETDTNGILRIANLLNKFPMYTSYNKGNSQTLRNDEKFKFILKDAVKDNRDIICICLNINNIHFKPSLKPEIFEVYIIDVEADTNYISIVFDCILEDEFEIFIIPEGLTIIFLVCCVHRTLIQEVGDL